MTKFYFRHATLNRISLRQSSLRFLITYLAFCAVQLPNAAEAWVDLSLSPIYAESNASIRDGGGSFPGEGAVGTTMKTGYDLRATLGVVLLNHILIGGSVNSSGSSAQRSAVGTTDTEKSVKDSSLEYGPTLGLVYDGFHFSVTYLMGGTRKQSATLKDTSNAVVYNGDLTDKEGTGYQAKIGYAFHVTRSFLLGPTLVYRQVTYSKQDFTNHLSASASYSDKSYETKPVEGSLTPFVSAIFSF